MIRPLGRENLSDYDNALESFGEIGKEGIDYEFLKGKPKGKEKEKKYYSHCELWIQIAPEGESVVWNKIKNWIKINKHGIARRSLSDSIWRPYDSNFTHENNYYPRYGDEIEKKSEPKFIQRIISKEQVPWFIKLIWGRATALILFRSSVKDNILLLNPSKDMNKFISIYEEILSDIDLEGYGFTSSTKVISPMHFGASHMAAFVLNALVSKRDGGHQLTHYCPSMFMYPFLFPSKRELFSQLKQFT
jgi:hypothetical protein